MSYEAAAIVFRPEGVVFSLDAVMKLSNDDIVSRLLGERPAPTSSWLILVGEVTLVMTPIALILAGIWGALFVSAFLFLVWLASVTWVSAQRGSLAHADVLLSGTMVVAWPGSAVIAAWL